MRKQFLSILIGAASLASALPGNAAIVNFDYLASGTSVAHGTFSYADGKTGTLGYNDLTSFDLTIGTKSYSLSDIAGFNDYRWFAYDTLNNSFVVGNNLSGFGGGGYSASLAATNAAGTAGFFFAAGMFAEYSSYRQIGFDTIRLTPQANQVPEPTSLLLAGAALAGLAYSRRKAA